MGRPVDPWMDHPESLDLTPGEIVARHVAQSEEAVYGKPPSVPGRTPGVHAPGTEDSHCSDPQGHNTRDGRHCENCGRDLGPPQRAEAQEDDTMPPYGKDVPTAGVLPTEEVNPKDLVGVLKAPLRLVPPALTIGTAAVMALGATKYGPFNWREFPVKLSVYLEAIERHYLAVKDGQWLDPESGEPHVFHISACVGIIVDARANGKLVEDWPVFPGPAAELLAEQDKSK